MKGTVQIDKSYSDNFLAVELLRKFIDLLHDLFLKYL